MTNLSATAATHSAVTVVNATATGRGASLGIQGGVKATWTWREEPGVHLDSDVDDRLAQAALAVLQERLDRTPPGAWITTQSSFPPSRGLKTSSAAAAAMLRAATKALGSEMSPAELIHAAIDASCRAEVTLTGAFDDQIAVVHGGCHFTDNTIPSVLRIIRTKPWHVAVWVPEAAIPKADVRRLDTRPIRSAIEEAEAILERGDIPGALQENGDAFLSFYAQEGLPVSDAPVNVALHAGAEAAGLSGTGPAVAALFADQVDLPAVKGGRWHWSRVVEGPA